MLVVGSIFFLSVWRKDVWAQPSGRSGSDGQALVVGGSGVQALVKNLDSGVKNHVGLRPPRWSGG